MTTYTSDVTVVDVSSMLMQLQSYRWPEIWSAVRHMEPEPNAQRTPALALKALLLASWWQDHEQARACVAAYSNQIKDPLTHFALCYTAMCLRDIPLYEELSRQQTSNPVPWLRQWLELEMLGRLGKSDNQIRLLRRIVPINTPPPAWIYIALLQSNESPRINTRHLRDWLQSLPKICREQDLARALALRCNLIQSWIEVDKEIVVEQLSPPVLYRYALHTMAKQRPVDALHAYDILARTSFIDLSAIQAWLQLACSTPQGWKSLGARIQFAINLAPRSLTVQGTVAGFALIAAWLRGDTAQSEAIVARFLPYLKLPETPSIRSMQVFFLYLSRLCAFRQHNPIRYLTDTNKVCKTLLALGESHALTLSGVHTSWHKESCETLTAFVMGIKMHHLSKKSDSYKKSCVRLHLENIKNMPIHLLLTIGEIDTRPNEGIWPLHRKQGLNLNELILSTVKEYIEFIQKELNDSKLLSITIQGIPAPGYALLNDNDPGDIAAFAEMIRSVNKHLCSIALDAGYDFLDVHAATADVDGLGNGLWHLDNYHLSPAFYQQAEKWRLASKKQRNFACPAGSH